VDSETPRVQSKLGTAAGKTKRGKMDPASRAGDGKKAHRQRSDSQNFRRHFLKTMQVNSLLQWSKGSKTPRIQSQLGPAAGNRFSHSASQHQQAQNLQGNHIQPEKGSTQEGS
jgi:hypothetical protein